MVNKDRVTLGSAKEIIDEINSVPTRERVSIISAYLGNINDALEETFDTGEWFQDMRNLRNHLQGQLERYRSFEFKTRHLDDFLKEVEERLIRRMEAAHEGRGNDWLWSDIPQEAREEWLDVAGFSILLLNRIRLEKDGQLELSPDDFTRSPKETGLESKLSGFDRFMEEVRERIVQGDAHHDSSWLTDDLEAERVNELVDVVAYAFFGWRKCNLLTGRETTESHGISQE